MKKVYDEFFGKFLIGHLTCLNSAQFVWKVQHRPSIIVGVLKRID